MLPNHGKNYYYRSLLLASVGSNSVSFAAVNDRPAVFPRHGEKRGAKKEVVRNVKDGGSSVLLSYRWIYTVQKEKEESLQCRHR